LALLGLAMPVSLLKSVLLKQLFASLLRQNCQKVDKINNGDNYIKDIRNAVLKQAVKDMTLNVTGDFSLIKE
jgi:hypothetical protein